MAFKVVVTNNIPFIVDMKVLRGGLSGVEFIEKSCDTEDEVIAAARDADAVVIGREPYTARVITSLKSCRLISTPKVGYDNIDINAATEVGICVACVAGVSTEEVSDMAMALLLTCARKVLQLDKAVRAGQWRTLHGPEMEEIWRGIAPLRGQTLGLLGFGLIARALLPKAKGFGFRILAYDPHVSAEIMDKMGVAAVSLERLLKESDFISIHAALTPQNRHLLGLEQFKMMKRSAYIINTARGAIIDEKALYTALTEGYIAGAGLDVMEIEPVKMDNPLLKLDNVVPTGHSGHYSDIATEKIRQRPVEDISRIMSGKWPSGWVNPQVEARFIARWGKTGYTR